MFSISSVICWTNVDNRIRGQITARRIGLAAGSCRPCSFLSRTPSRPIPRRRRYELDPPPPHSVYPRRQLDRCQRIRVVLGKRRYMDDHGGVASQGTETVLQQVCELVLLVGQVLLAVENG